MCAEKYYMDKILSCLESSLCFFIEKKLKLIYRFICFILLKFESILCLFSLTLSHISSWSDSKMLFKWLLKASLSENDYLPNELEDSKTNESQIKLCLVCMLDVLKHPNLPHVIFSLGVEGGGSGFTWTLTPLLNLSPPPTLQMFSLDLWHILFQFS